MCEAPPPNRRVLVIDDNPAIHEDFRKVLGGYETAEPLAGAEAALFGALPVAVECEAVFEVASAKQGREGFEMARQARAEGHPYAVAFVDIRMPPGWDGIETLARIWQEDPDIQAVLCTAYSDYTWNEVFNRLGRTDRLLILRKPFDNIEVQQLACALVQKWDLSRRTQLSTATLEGIVEERTAALTQANVELRREIADRRATEHALRKSEERYRRAHAETEQLLDALSSVLIEIGQDDRILRWSAVAEGTLGIAANAATGRQFAECNTALAQPSVAAAIAHCRREDRSVRLKDLPYTRPTGQPGFLGFTVYPVHDGTRSSGRVLVVGQDVTERRLLELQLGQAQKLESIGQLAAGIAHEINTPTQFLGDNARFLRDAFRDLQMLLEKYAALLNAGRAAGVMVEQVADLDEAIRRLELDYLVGEIPRAIEESIKGVQRVAKIVLAMKEFSHPGGEEREAVDLNRAIESTVTVARNEWKYVADVVTDLDPGLPLVPCLPGEINQVILNVLVNAAHAIADMVGDGADKKGTIGISSRCDGDWVEIRIQDTGGGIPESIRARVFDPFFTTKEVGKGTGQGLAIAHNVVVKKHGGTITFETSEGQGTTFIIRLPLTPDPSELDQQRGAAAAEPGAATAEQTQLPLSVSESSAPQAAVSKRSGS